MGEGMRKLLLLLNLLCSDVAPSFLTTEELTASRAGQMRNASGVQDFHSSDEVVPLIDGKAVMTSLLQDIRACKEGDSISSTMFEVNGDVMLDPLAADAESTRLTNVLVAAIGRNVSVRI